MPNPGADAPLRKVTLNLYEADCVELEARYGHGWTTMARNMIHDRLLTRTMPRRRGGTLGDIIND